MSVLLAGVDAFLGFVDRFVDFVDRFLAKAAFVGSGVFKIGARRSQQVKRRLHVRLIGRDVRRKNFRRAGRMIVAAVVSDALIDESYRVVHVLDRVRAMAAFVVRGRLKLRARLLQIGARRLHVGLVRVGDGRQSREQDENYQDKSSLEHRV